MILMLSYGFLLFLQSRCVLTKWNLFGSRRYYRDNRRDINGPKGPNSQFVMVFSLGLINRLWWNLRCKTGWTIESP